VSWPHLARCARGADRTGLQQVGAIDYAQPAARSARQLQHGETLARTSLHRSKTCWNDDWAAADGCRAQHFGSDISGAADGAHLCSTRTWSGELVRRFLMREQIEPTEPLGDSGLAPPAEGAILRLSVTLRRGTAAFLRHMREPER